LAQTGTPYLLDPQCYDVNYAHDDYPLGLGQCTTSDLLDQQRRAGFISTMLEYQTSIGVSQLIVPGIWTDTVNRNWLNIVSGGAQDARTWMSANGQDDTPLLATVAVAAGGICDPDHRSDLLDRLVTLPVDGIYLVFEGMDIQPQDEGRLYAAMDMVFRLEQNGFRTLLGYASYWACLCCAVGLDTFASGGFENRRAFSAAEWTEEEEADEEVRHAPRPRYWTPATLGKIRFPDEAELLADEGLWSRLGPGAPYCQALFGAQRPGAATWRRRDSFQHYLYTCRELASGLSPLGFDERGNYIRELIDSAISLQEEFADEGVVLAPESTGQHLASWRSVIDSYVEANRFELEEEFA